MQPSQEIVDQRVDYFISGTRKIEGWGTIAGITIACVGFSFESEMTMTAGLVTTFGSSVSYLGTRAIERVVEFSRR